VAARDIAPLPLVALACEELRILLVDDDPSFRTSLAELFRSDGHEVCDYAGPGLVPPTAVAEVQLAVTDLRMGGGRAERSRVRRCRELFHAVVHRLV
jgi:CheY-like chemotaxis protein